MKDSSSRFVIIVSYLAMVLFFVIPVVKIWLGHPFNVLSIITTLAIGFGFGFYATYELQKYEERGESKDE